MVSVIMPVKDTPPALLLRAVLSAQEQDTSQRVEIVVWDDGTRDRDCRAAIAALARTPGVVVSSISPEADVVVTAIVLTLLGLGAMAGAVTYRVHVLRTRRDIEQGRGMRWTVERRAPQRTRQPVCRAPQRGSASPALPARPHPLPLIRAARGPAGSDISTGWAGPLAQGGDGATGRIGHLGRPGRTTRGQGGVSFGGRRLLT
jgi:hypothetical protein